LIFFYVQGGLFNIDIFFLGGLTESFSVFQIETNISQCLSN